MFRKTKLFSIERNLGPSMVEVAGGSAFPGNPQASTGLSHHILLSASAGACTLLCALFAVRTLLYGLRVVVVAGVVLGVNEWCLGRGHEDLRGRVTCNAVILRSILAYLIRSQHSLLCTHNL
jgi:hypothetical protein